MFFILARSKSQSSGALSQTSLLPAGVEMATEIEAELAVAASSTVLTASVQQQPVITVVEDADDEHEVRYRRFKTSKATSPLEQNHLCFVPFFAFISKTVNNQF